MEEFLEKILLLGDIHANRVALEQVLKDAGDVDRILYTGDIVDYNPWPLESIILTQDHKMTSVLGNHDRDSARGTPIGYNPYAKISCLWTYGQLTQNARRYLSNLPEKVELTVNNFRLFMCHGSPNNLVDEYIYPPPITPKEVLRGFLKKTGVRLVILGHTHIPFVESFPEGYVINPGSVGQPRSGNPKASYMTLEIDYKKISIIHHLVSYDVYKVSKRIVEVGLPLFLAERLHLGI